MRKMLRSFLNWLDTRFPEKVTVTLVDHIAQKVEIRRIADLIAVVDQWAKKTDERLTQVEQAIRNLNMAMGLGSAAEKLKVMPFQR